MVQQIKLGDVDAEVVLKDIKNVHLSVYPPAGRVRISAPTRMSLDTIRVFAISKLPWIRQQQRKLRDQARETARQYVDRESHYVWGRRYLLDVAENEGPPFVALKHRHMILGVRPRTGPTVRDEILANWYRGLVRAEVPGLIAKWEPMLCTKVKEVFVQRMKTKWGSCNPRARTIRLNTELAKKPKDCLDYIVLHEMVHLVEPRHGERFVALMDQFLPRWQFVRQKLNRLPIRHADWDY